jgi:hypothetical protein
LSIANWDLCEVSAGGVGWHARDDVASSVERFAIHTCRGKRLRLGLLNVPARVVRSARRLYLRLPAAYQHAAVFIAALERIRALPAFV